MYVGGVRKKVIVDSAATTFTIDELEELRTFTIR